MSSETKIMLYLSFSWMQLTLLNTQADWPCTAAGVVLRYLPEAESLPLNDSMQGSKTAALQGTVHQATLHLPPLAVVSQGDGIPPPRNQIAWAGQGEPERGQVQSSQMKSDQIALLSS